MGNSLETDLIKYPIVGGLTAGLGGMVCRGVMGYPVSGNQVEEQLIDDTIKGAVISTVGGVLWNAMDVLPSSLLP